MGSNVLVADEGFPGYVLRLEGDFLKVAIEGERLTGRRRRGRSAASARRPRAPGSPASRRSRAFPSSIGGAVRINAGAYGGEIFDVLESRAPGLARRASAAPVRGAEIPHGYRWSSSIDTREIVSEAVLKLAPAPARGDRRRRRAPVADKRRGALPVRAQRRQRLQEPAGRLRRAADRGLRPEGRAGGRRADLRAPRQCDREHRRRAGPPTSSSSCGRMRDAVREKFGVTLLPEVEMLGVKWE